MFASTVSFLKASTSAMLTEPVDKMKLARRTFTLELKADVVRHRKPENLSWIDAGKAFDVLPTPQAVLRPWHLIVMRGGRV